MEIIEDIPNKVKFMMETDWLFQEPIDFEHKKYVLLAYFKKIDDLLIENKIYPTFIEISLHLASLQTLIKEEVILSTSKQFLTFDDEVLLKELTAKSIPEFKKEEKDEITKIIEHSSMKFYEYFGIVKSYWSTIYESIDMSIKRNKKYLNRQKGYFVYTQIKSNHIFVWEYFINPIADINEYNLKIKLIYDGDKKEKTLNKVIEEFSSYKSSEIRVAPVFDFKSSSDYPIEETLLPLFKRKLLAYIYQSSKPNLQKKIA